MTKLNIYERALAQYFCKNQPKSIFDDKLHWQRKLLQKFFLQRSRLDLNIEPMSCDDFLRWCDFSSIKPEEVMKSFLLEELKDTSCNEYNKRDENEERKDSFIVGLNNKLVSIPYMKFSNNEEKSGEDNKETKENEKIVSNDVKDEDLNTKVSDVINLQNTVEKLEINRSFTDADTILSDAIYESDNEESGMAIELLEIYQSSKDKETFEKLFELFTSITFEKYLDVCNGTLKSLIKDYLKI